MQQDLLDEIIAKRAQKERDLQESKMNAQKMTEKAIITFDSAQQKKDMDRTAKLADLKARLDEQRRERYNKDSQLR